MDPDSSQSELPSPDFDDVAENRDVILTAPDGTKWHQITPDDYSAGRLLQQNILSLHLMHAEMYLLEVPQVHCVFLFYFLIALFSNISQNAQLQKPTANQKIRRLLLLLKNWKLSSLSCMRGKLQKKVIYLLHDIRTEGWGVSLCKNAMSRNRLCKILRFLRFDIKSNFSQRLLIDKFALFSEVWNCFIDNCYMSYKPGAFITVDCYMSYKQATFP